MERNVQVLFLALGVIVVIALFSGGGLTGKAGRGISTCSDTDGGYRVQVAGTVVKNVGGEETWYQDRCAEPGNRLVEYYCVGNEKQFREDWCPGGTTCLTGQDAGGRPYGVSAYCG